MAYQGDYAIASTVVFNFNTASFADGSPITLAGSPTLACYKNSTTESTSGITLTVDYDSRTGLHHVVVDTSSDGTFYATANDFSVVLTAGTVGGTSVVGREVGSFSLQNRSALRPTTAGRTLDVSSTGEAGVDWANVGSPTTSLNLSATTISASQVVASVTGAVGSVTGAVGSVTGAVGSVTGNVGGNVTGSVGSVAGDVSGNVTGNVGGNVTGSVGSIATGGIAAASIAANALDDKGNWLQPTTAGRKLDVTTGGEAGIDWNNIGSPSTSVNLSGTTISTSQAVASVAGAVGSVTGNVGGNVAGTVASVVGNVGGNVTGTVASVVGNVGGNVTGSVASVTAPVTTGGFSSGVTPWGFKKNTTYGAFTFKMVDSSDHITPATGLTVTAERSIDGAAFEAMSNSVVEISDGFYVISVAAADLNASSESTFLFTATGADPVSFKIPVQGK